MIICYTRYIIRAAVRLQQKEKYSSYELEVLAIIKFLKKFRVKIIMDCKTFSLIMNKKNLCVRVARWALQLEEFDYIIEHGKTMTHVDILSRNPLLVYVERM